MPKLRLTISEVKKIRPLERRTIYYDDRLIGFALRVEPTGIMTYFCEYRPGRGRRYAKKRYTIARHGEMTPDQARTEAARILARVRLGDDPQAERRAAARRLPETTFKAVAERYIELVAKPNQRRWKETERLLTKHALPAFGRLDMTEVTRRDVAALVDEMAAGGAPQGARRFLEALRPVFAFARDRGVIEVNPIADLKPPAPPTRRDRVLTLNELRAILAAAKTLEAPWPQLVHILALTAQRRGEVGGMMWKEVAPDGKTWTIPAARTKNQRAHIVPLAPVVRRRLASLREIPGASGVYAFSGRGGRPVGNWSKTKALLDKKLTDVAPWTWHDLRRTAATLMGEALAVQPHVVEAVLNHVSGSKAGVAGTYNRALYADEKRRALRLWAAYVLRGRRK